MIFNILNVFGLLNKLTGMFRDWRIKQAGRKEAKLEAAERENRRAEISNRIRRDIDLMDDDELQELADKWTSGK